MALELVGIEVDLAQVSGRVAFGLVVEVFGLRVAALAAGSLDDASWVGMRLAEILPIPPSERQVCLELDDPIARLERLSAFIKASPD